MVYYFILFNLNLFINILDDPQCVHSEYLLLIKDLNEKMSIRDIISLERISVSTKKKYLLAYFNEETNDINYKYLEWTNI
jgi:tRNA splicing endonuclease